MVTLAEASWLAQTSTRNAASPAGCGDQHGIYSCQTSTWCVGWPVWPSFERQTRHSLVTERYNCHGVKGVCRGENVVDATSRAAMEELIAPIGGNMTGSVDSNSHSRTTWPSSCSAARQWHLSASREHGAIAVTPLDATPCSREPRSVLNQT